MPAAGVKSIIINLVRLYNRRNTILNTKSLSISVTSGVTVGAKTTTYTFSPVH